MKRHAEKNKASKVANLCDALSTSNDMESVAMLHRTVRNLLHQYEVEVESHDRSMPQVMERHQALLLLNDDACSLGPCRRWTFEDPPSKDGRGRRSRVGSAENWRERISLPCTLASETSQRF